jgi:hypothetical protein
MGWNGLSRVNETKNIYNIIIINDRIFQRSATARKIWQKVVSPLYEKENAFRRTLPFFLSPCTTSD